MTRLEKCEYLKEKGYTYDPSTGKVFNSKGKEITGKSDGYIIIRGILKAHHYGWYCVYGGDMDFEMLDHDNRITDDNRICNLRIVDNQENQFNTDAKGYCWDKSRNKWISIITINGKRITLGRFDKEEDARQAYINAKKIYHI